MVYQFFKKNSGGRGWCLATENEMWPVFSPSLNELKGVVGVVKVFKGRSPDSTITSVGAFPEPEGYVAAYWGIGNEYECEGGNLFLKLTEDIKASIEERVSKLIREGKRGQAFGVMQCLEVMGYGYIRNCGAKTHHNLRWWVNQIEESMSESYPVNEV